jgi:hypothetical protein
MNARVEFKMAARLERVTTAARLAVLFEQKNLEKKLKIN